MQYYYPYGAAPYIPTPLAPPDPYKAERKEMRRAASRLSFAAVSAVLVSGVLSTLFIVLLSGLGVNIYDPWDGVNGVDPTFYYLLSGLLSFCSIVAPFSLFLLAGHRRFSETVLAEKVGFTHAALIVFAGLFVCIVMNIPANYISEFLKDAGLNGDANTESFVVNSWTEMLSMWLAVVFIAPVTEELCYRGITVAVMRRWGDWPAVIFSALIFGMAHFSFQALPVVLMGGFVMAFLYVRTRNIWVNIAIHFLNNLVATLPISLGFLFGDDVVDPSNMIAMIVIMVLGVASVITLSVKYLSNRQNIFGAAMQKGVPVPKKFLQLFLNPGMISYLVIFVVMSLLMLYGLY